MTVAKRRLLALVIAVAGVLAAVAGGMHVTAMSIGGRAPQLGTSLSSSAPQPYETLMRYALGEARDASGSGSAAEVDFSAAKAPAEQVVERSLLSPGAVAVLAWNTPPARRSQLTEAAAALGKREPLLQALLIDEFQRTNQYDRMLQTIDSMVRVSPSMAHPLAVSLVPLLQDDAMIPDIARLMQSSPDWSEPLLIEASKNPRLAANLTKLRLSLPESAEIADTTDQTVLANLVRAGNTSAAARLYSELNMASGDGRLAVGKSIGWGADLPPYDWELTDSYDAYVRTRPGGGFDVRIRPGNGGELAKRLLALPAGARAIQVRHTMGPASQLDDLRIAVVCAQTGAEISSRAFGASPFAVDLPSAGQKCDTIWLNIEGSAKATGDVIQGTITGLDLK